MTTIPDNIKNALRCDQALYYACNKNKEEALIICSDLPTQLKRELATDVLQFFSTEYEIYDDMLDAYNVIKNKKYHVKNAYHKIRLNEVIKRITAYFHIMQLWLQLQKEEE